MAHYLKFEIYLPVQYTDSGGNKRELDPDVVLRLGDEIRQRFQGYTEWNRMQAPPFRGVWTGERGITIDHLISIFTLVPLDKEQQAMEFFREWKEKLEDALFQEFVLIIFSPIQVIGQL